MKNYENYTSDRTYFLQSHSFFLWDQENILILTILDVSVLSLVLKNKDFLLTISLKGQYKKIKI